MYDYGNNNGVCYCCIENESYLTSKGKIYVKKQKAKTSENPLWFSMYRAFADAAGNGVCHRK